MAGADPAGRSRPAQPGRPAIRPRQPAARAREPLRRPRTGRRHRLTRHSGSAHRNDVPAMLSGGGGQPQRWDIVAAGTTSMGHRCGSPAPLSSIDVPSLRLRLRLRLRAGARAGGRVPGVPGVGGSERRAPGTGDSGHQKVQVRGHAFPVGGQFKSSSAACSSLNVTGNLSCGGMLPRRFRCSGLAALRSGSACPRMTSGSEGAS